MWNLFIKTLHVSKHSTSKRKKPGYKAQLLLVLAEREGFEPSLGLTLNTLSRRAPSATQPPLQLARIVRKSFTAFKY